MEGTVEEIKSLYQEVFLEEKKIEKANVAKNKYLNLQFNIEKFVSIDKFE